MTDNTTLTVNGTQAITAAGQVANMYATGSIFADYTSRLARNTQDARRADLDLWAVYLATATAGHAAYTGADYMAQPATWQGVTWGLVTGFVAYLVNGGRAVGSINRALSTVKIYAGLAVLAGAITADDGAMIRAVKGYSHRQGKQIDATRTAAGSATRISNKKAVAVTITPAQAAALKAQPDTAQGRRDAVIMCLLLDHGLRVGEVALLQVTDFDLKAGKFSFYRPKVDRVQTHRMTADTRRALAAWLATDAPAMGPLLRGSRKGGHLTGAGMIDRAITERVTVLGAAIGLAGLSAHDCRHYWATRAAQAGTDAFALRDAGGWSSLAMPSRYVEAAAVANDRVKLGD